MNDLNYYKIKGQPASREEMFDYIETLLISGSYADANAAFADLKKIELGRDVATRRKIEVDEKAPALTQIRSIMKNTLAWRMVQKPQQKSAQKLPTEEAIEKFRSLKLNHDNLQEFERTSPPQHQIALLSYHGAWDVDWVLARLDHYDCGLANSIICHTPNMNLIKRALPRLANYHWSQAPFGDGRNLDDETLKLVLSKGHLSVAGDPRVTEEDLIKLWESLATLSPENHHAKVSALSSVIGRNHNAPGWLLDACTQTNTYFWGFEILLLTNPNLPSESIEHILSHTRDKEARMLIARHPNTRLATLKKLSRSAYQPLAELASEKLYQREAERKGTK